MPEEDFEAAIDQIINEALEAGLDKRDIANILGVCSRAVANGEYDENTEVVTSI